MYRSEINEYLNKHSEEMVQDICRLIKIKSIREAAVDGMPYGHGPARALEEAGKIADNMDFSTTHHSYILL